MIAASALSSCIALERYPDPLSCLKYYVRNRDSTFSHLTCPNGLVFEDSAKLCVQEGSCQDDRPDITYRRGDACASSAGYYCNGDNTFTYCTYDHKRIVNNKACPADSTNMIPACGIGNNPCPA